MRSIAFHTVYDGDIQEHERILYELLKERTPEQSISHKELPTYEQHIEFVRSKPYKDWYLIKSEEGYWVGSIYLTHQHEVGIFIFKQYFGNRFGEMAVSMLKHMTPGRLLANVSPQNSPSHKLFRRMGWKIIQVTYQAGDE